jgi:MFS family permease
MPLRSGTDKQAAQAAAGPLGGNGLHGWRHPAILAAAALSFASGYGQFIVTTTLPDVARAFGESTGEGASLADQVGLSGTKLGIGLAVIRLASLAALPLSGLADRFGRRRVVLSTTAAGLALTAAAALAPGYWWFVAIVALGRPSLSATNALAGVVAAEETRTRDRAKAVALITAGYGVGAGSSALLRGTFDLAFRPLFAFSLVLLVALIGLGRFVGEPARFDRVRGRAERGPSLLRRLPLSGPLGAHFRVLAGTYFAITFLTGPVNNFLFLFGENVLGMPSSTTAIAVFSVGPLGALGLLVGRWAADRLGRIPTALTAHVLVSLGGVLAYTGTPATLFAGYFMTILCGSALAPAAGSLAAELFPTSIRSTVAGAFSAIGTVAAVSGLVAFGLLADRFGGFRVAALTLGAVAVTGGLLYRRLPETRDLELEESAPER